MLKIGILGAARIAPQAIIDPAARRDDVTIHAVASRRIGAAGPYAEAHGIGIAYDGYDDLLADPAIDLVYNALPPVDHARWSIKALEAGKHVLCEKPFAMNAREADVMVDTATRTGKRLIEAFHDRLHPAFQSVRKLVADGALGRIEHIAAAFEVHIPFSEREIRHLPDQGGGALMDLGCYPVHWARALLGEEPEVTRASGIRTRLGVDERIEADLAFPCGATARISTDLSEGTPLNAFLKVLGSNGEVTLDNPVLPHKGHSIRTVLDGISRVETVAGGTSFDFQLQSVLDALATGAPHPNEGADSIGNMRVIDAIYEKAGFGPR